MSSLSLCHNKALNSLAEPLVGHLGPWFYPTRTTHCVHLVEGIFAIIYLEVNLGLTEGENLCCESYAEYLSVQ